MPRQRPSCATTVGSYGGLVRTRFDGSGCGIPSGTYEEGLHRLGRQFEAHRPANEPGTDPRPVQEGPAGWVLLHPRAPAKPEAISVVHGHIKRIEARLYDLA